MLMVVAKKSVVFDDVLVVVGSDASCDDRGCLQYGLTAMVVEVATSVTTVVVIVEECVVLYDMLVIVGGGASCDDGVLGW